MATLTLVASPERTVLVVAAGETIALVVAVQQRKIGLRALAHRPLLVGLFLLPAIHLHSAPAQVQL